MKQNVDEGFDLGLILVSVFTAACEIDDFSVPTEAFTLPKHVFRVSGENIDFVSIEKCQTVSRIAEKHYTSR